jgi:F-type H+-transporting ATPase subunit alpha
MKKVAGTLRLDLAQYRELASFAAFGSDLDAATQAQLSRGERLVELLKQSQYAPMEAVEQVVVIYAATKGHFDVVPTKNIKDAEKELLDYMKAKHSDLLESIKTTGKIEDESKLEEAVKTFVGTVKF